jgi:hypothetical protein
MSNPDAPPDIRIFPVPGAAIPQTQKELDAGVVPVVLGFQPGDVRRNAATGDGVTNDTAAVQDALDSAWYVWLQPDTDYLVDTLVPTSGDPFIVNGILNISTGEGFPPEPPPP